MKKSTIKTQSIIITSFFVVFQKLDGFFHYEKKNKNFMFENASLFIKKNDMHTHNNVMGKKKQ